MSGGVVFKTELREQLFPLISVCMYFVSVVFVWGKGNL